MLGVINETEQEFIVVSIQICYTEYEKLITSLYNKAACRNILKK